MNCRAGSRRDGAAARGRMNAPAGKGASRVTAGRSHALMLTVTMLSACIGAAWLWNRRGEAVLHARTGRRLRPRGEGSPAR